MKKLLFIISFITLSILSIAQSGEGWVAYRAKSNFRDSVNFAKSFRLGNITVTATGLEVNMLAGVTSNIQTQLNAKAPIANPNFTGTVRVNTTDTLATRAYVRAEGGSGGSMTYPGAGIPLSTGSAWGTSITNNSTNWNTAYSWGNHASAGYALTSALSSYVPITRTVNAKALSANITITASDVGLGNVTNESKATMFTSPTFTTAVNLPSIITIGGTALAPSITELNYTDNLTSNVQTQINNINANLNDSTTFDYEISAQTTSYTLALTDNYKIVTMNSASATNLTVPPNASVAFPIGANITICCLGAGKTTVVAGSGVTILSKGSLLGITVLGDATLIKLATNTWKLIGSLE